MGNLLKLTLILFTFALGNDIFVVSGTQCLPQNLNTDEKIAISVGNMLSKKALGLDITTCPPPFEDEDLKYCCHFNHKTGCCKLSTYIFTELHNNLPIVVCAFIMLVIIIICCCVCCCRRR